MSNKGNLGTGEIVDVYDFRDGYIILTILILLLFHQFRLILKSAIEVL